MNSVLTEPDRQNGAALALSRAIRAIHQRGWCDGTGGNFSVVMTRTPLQLLMAPSGVDKGSVEPEDLILVDQDGQVLQGEGRASAETALHLAILTTTGAGAVLHTHSQSATLLSQLPNLGKPARATHSPGTDETLPECCQIANQQPEEALLGYLEFSGLEMLKGFKGITSHEQVIQLPILANSQEMQRLCEAAQPLLDEAPYALLIAGHGLYAWGDSLVEAKRHLEVMEFLLEQQWRQFLLHGLLSRGT